MARPRVALVHDWMVSPGGGERTLFELHKLWPEAPIYTSAYDPEKFPEFADADVRTTWLNKIKLARRKQQLFSIPRAWSFLGLDLSEYDIVISSSSAESKYVKTGDNTLHLCYCHTPIRYYWSDYDWYRKHPPFGKLNWLAGAVLPVLIGPLRRMDYKAAQRVSQFIANSEYVRARIKQYYHRDAAVIYPPVETERFARPRQPRDYYLVHGRQVAYKRLDLVIDAFNELGYPLKVSGSGEEVDVQRARAKANIEFLGRTTDAEVNDLFAAAKGFVWPQNEDFGITVVEAMAAGCPAIAYGVGGALESVVEGVTGTFFERQTKSDLIEAVHRFERMKFDEVAIRARAKEFDSRMFRERIRTYVEAEWAKFDRTREA